MFRFRAFSLLALAFWPAWLTFLIVLVRQGRDFEGLTWVFVAILIGVGIYQWLWNLVGMEELEFTPNELIYRRKWYRLAHSKYYVTAEIAGPHFYVRRGKGGYSALAFYSGEKTVIVCRGIKQK